MTREQALEFIDSQFRGCLSCSCRSCVQKASKYRDAIAVLTDQPTLAGIPVRFDPSIPLNEIHVEQANGDTTIIDMADLPSGFARCGVCRADYPLGTRHDCKATEPTI
jgi:hypothetical protein